MSENVNGGGLVLPKKLTWSAVFILCTGIASVAVAHYRVSTHNHGVAGKLCLLCNAMPSLGPNAAACIKICTE